MKHLVSKDIKTRFSFLNTEHRRAFLLSLYRNEFLAPSVRFLLQPQLRGLVKSNPVRVKNRCIITGRSHSVSRFFKLSRIQFRLFALHGVIPGIQKSSW